MANHKSAKKRARQTVKKNAHNRAKRTAVRSVLKNLREAIANKDKQAAPTLLQDVQGRLAKLGKSSAMEKKAAARVTSRLTQQVNNL